MCNNCNRRESQGTFGSTKVNGKRLDRGPRPPEEIMRLTPVDAASAKRRRLV